MAKMITQAIAMLPGSGPAKVSITGTRPEWNRPLVDARGAMQADTNAGVHRGVKYGGKSKVLLRYRNLRG